MTSGYRTANRRVEFHVELTGDPIIWTSHYEGSRPVRPEMVRLTFGHGDDGFFMEATITGPWLSKVNGRPLKAAKESHYAGPPDLWPEWLKVIAREHRPDGYSTHSGPIVQ